MDVEKRLPKPNKAYLKRIIMRSLIVSLLALGVICLSLFYQWDDMFPDYGTKIAEFKVLQSTDVVHDPALAILGEDEGMILTYETYIVVDTDNHNEAYLVDVSSAQQVGPLFMIEGEDEDGDPVILTDINGEFGALLVMNLNDKKAYIVQYELPVERNATPQRRGADYKQIQND